MKVKRRSTKSLHMSEVIPLDGTRVRTIINQA